ncbi:MFS transporter [Streptomyces sp. 549]|uniref:MFS transporter n=1 Tax=Streptomyces sp. 549 TaxID=3049076 RepID=UPI0024C2BC68|nr:MFS transporter [Streptomyces sp. 549]MDK1473952.1 MFS transporter [Streptomyces sp. 549]
MRRTTAGVPDRPPLSKNPQAAPPGYVPLLGAATLGLYTALMTPVVLTLALRVAEVAPDNKEAVLGLVLGVGAVFALVANPAAGRLSDRTRSRYGRRRPWLVGGVAGGVLGLAVIALVPSVPALVLGWSLVQTSFNAVYAALLATIPDQVPPDGRGRASGAVGAGVTAAVLVGAGIVALVPDLRAQLLLPVVLTVVLVGWFARSLRDQRPADAPQPFSVREFLTSFVFDPRRHPDFGWAWLTKFLVVFGAVAPMTYLVYYVPFLLDSTPARTAGTVAGLVALNFALQALTAFAGGWISDRTGRRKPFVIASGLVVATGLAMLAAAPDLTWLAVALAVTGIGGGLFYAVDLALITEVLPDPDNPAKDLGVVNIANALPQSLMPMIAPAVLLTGGGDNYTLLFALAAASAALGSLLVTRIRSAR